MRPTPPLSHCDITEFRARAAMSGDRERIADIEAMRREIERLRRENEQLRKGKT